MHRTLKLEATLPPEYTLLEQQERLDAWRQRFNEQRPHEALGQCTPASRYQPSPRRLPREAPGFRYPSYFESRYVRADGMFHWNGSLVFLGEAFARCRIGLIHNYDGQWLVYAGEYLIGSLLLGGSKRVVPIRELIG